MHIDGARIAVVACGAFFGTLARYQIGLRVPAAKDGWPRAIFAINILGAFLLGFFASRQRRRPAARTPAAALGVVAGRL